ncbi:MAG: hypothetical protein AMJ61_09800 [Desulfobacterales bacterium SG8_35_2]|nr:MAG: hypothetical protein AMJ61_09800 [Desulfobacterales bacterium SG8_35_2]
MKKNLSTTLRLISLISFMAFGLVTFIGCSGGGGGGGVSSAINYTGVTTQAIIDENNAVDIATGSLVGGEIGSNLNILGAVSENSNSIKSPRVFNIASYFQNVIYQIESATIQSAGYLGAIVSESDTIAGSCGGSFSITLTADDQTGNFNGSLTFNNFCEPEFSVNGSMDISGNIDVNMGQMNYFEMVFMDINMTSGQESISMNGSINFNMQASPMRMTMSFILQDNNLNKTYRYENFVYEYAQGVGYEDITLTGRYYDHDYGYVDITTESPLRINEYDLWPSTGTVIATGNSGTKARLTVIDSSSFFVEADTDGDGSYDDYNSGQILWSSI